MWRDNPVGWTLFVVSLVAWFCALAAATFALHGMNNPELCAYILMGMITVVTLGFTIALIKTLWEMIQDSSFIER